MKTQIHDTLDCRTLFTVLDKVDSRISLLSEVITYYFHKEMFEHYHEDCLNRIYPKCLQLLPSFFFYLEEKGALK